MRKKPTANGRNTDAGRSYNKPSGDRDRKPFKKEGEGRSGRSFGEDKPKRSFGDDKPKRPYGTRSDDSGKPKRPYGTRGDDSADRPKRSFSDDKPKRSFGKDRDEKSFDRPKRSFGDDKPKRSFDRDDKNSDRPKRSFSDDKPKRSFGKDRDEKSFDRPKRSFGDDKPKRSFDRNDKNSDRPKRSFSDDKPKRSFGKDRDEKSFDRPKRSFGDDKPKRSFDRDDKGSDRPKRSYGDDKPKRSFDRDDKDSDKPKRSFGDKKMTFSKPEKDNDFDKPYPLGSRKVSGPFRKQFEQEKKQGITDNERSFKNKKVREEGAEIKEMTLNKYIAHSGQCSRRDAAELVKQGKVKVNGELALDPGYRVQPFDEVTIAGKKLTPQKGRVYILLNKPKGYITTTDDPEGRSTVMELVEDAGQDRLFPVGRLDRNTTGLLLLTNDGDLAQKLSHPSYEIKKVYQVSLNKPLAKTDFEKIANGLMLEDGEVKVDEIAYLDEKTELGLEIHNGRNRIVRRIFESLGYEVEKLDRVMYAGLTKKNLPRGSWRFLEEKEVIILKHFKS